MADQLDHLKAALSDRYRIERELGSGGMATVYLAQDLKHERQVAVKVLRPELANVVGADRFLNEIKVTAGLQHPHILALHDSGDADSFLYYVMPYVEGESLRDRLSRESVLAVTEAIEILREIADGLAYAHERGIVHRDIKPDNVLISGRHALLADLGISKAVSDTTGSRKLTTVGVVLGTPEYMAPEQAAADPNIDHRADIYAFGVVAYEMLAGFTPFEGKTAQEVLAAHLIDVPKPIIEHRAGLPDRLSRLVMTCLEKDPAQRWQSAEKLVQELGAVARDDSVTETAVVPPSSKTHPRVKRVTPIALVSIGASLVALWLVTIFTPGNVEARSRIAVLPFENLSGAEDEYFSEGVTRDINTRISKIDDFVVIAHGSARRVKVAGQSYQEMADQLGVHYVVDGSVSRAGDRVLITAALIDPETDEQLWTNEYDRELSAEHIFTIRGDVAQQVASALDVTLSPDQETELAAQPTDNLEAYQEYLLGLFHWEKRTLQGFTDAIRHFERAIAHDSGYALAYAGLADVYLVRPWFSTEYSNREGLTLADSMARMALALDPSLGQPHATLGLVHEWQFEWEESEREFVRSVELDPEYATSRHWYGLLLARLGRYEEALREVRTSLELDPLSPIINQDVGYALHLAGERDAALRQYERTVELHPDFATTIMVLAWTYLDEGRFEEARGTLSRWAELTGSDAALVRQVADLAAQYTRTGEPQAPTGLDVEAVFPPYAVAPLYVRLGQHELALDFLERGYEDGAFGVVASIAAPPVNELRSHPRFVALVQKVGLRK
jgi:serine/threonine-protein kinase